MLRGLQSLYQIATNDGKPYVWAPGSPPSTASISVDPPSAISSTDIRVEYTFNGQPVKLHIVDRLGHPGRLYLYIWD